MARGASPIPCRDSWVLALRVRPGNDQCADCRDCNCEKCTNQEPVWASLELGTIVCDECKSLHETITKVEFKSILQNSDWTEEEWKRMEETSNEEVNEIYEKRVPQGYQKPTRCFHRAFRETWLTSKYVKRLFVATETSSGPLDRQSRIHFKADTTGFPAYLKIGGKTGYLWKRGREDNMYQKRWFEFSIGGAGATGASRALLVYYSDANKQHLRGEVSLNNVHVCLVYEKIHHPNGLQLIIEEGRQIRMIYLYADNEKDMVEWYQAICIVKFWVARHARLESKQPLDEKQILRNLNHEVLLEGPLQKWTKRGFRRRWFILYGKRLVYFNNELDANPLKWVKLGSCKEGFSLVIPGEVDPQWPRGFPFILYIPGRKFDLIADSDAERQAWFRAIFRACNPRPNLQVRPKPPPRPKEDIPLPKPPTSVSPKREPLPAVPDHGQRKTSLPVPVVQRDQPSPLPRRSEPFLRTDLSEYMSDSSSSYPGTESPYLRPISPKNIHPPVSPRPPETLIPSSDSGSEGEDYLDIPSGDDDDEESRNYVEMEIVPVICAKVDSLGTCVKAHGFCLRIPHEAMGVGRENKIFVSVTPLQTECPEIATGDQSGINAHGAQIVECRCFNYRKSLVKSLQLEIPHCAIIGDLAECKVKLWHKESPVTSAGSPDTTQWQEVLDTGTAMSCRVKQRCVQISTLHMGSYAFLIDGPGVRGKAMQMAVFTKATRNCEQVIAIIYLFNNISSDSVWVSIEEKEFNDGAILSDLSTSFSVQRDGGDLSLKLHDLEGLQLSADEPSILDVPSKQLWQSPFSKFKVQFDYTAPQCKAHITLSQRGVDGADGWQEDAVFTFLADEHGTYCMPVDPAAWQARSQHLITQVPGSRASLLPDDSNYVSFEFSPLPSRHTSDRRAAQRKQSIRRHQASFFLRHRMSPMSRTTPHGLRRTGSIGSSGEASSSTTTTTTSETGSDGSSQNPGSTIPEGLKYDLSKLLDGWAEFGNDWSMLARYVGLEHLMHRFIISSHPTVSVLNCCEKYNLSLSYLEEALRAIDREDAASLIKSCIKGVKDMKLEETEEL